MNLPGYTLDLELHRGRKRVVYRARRALDGRPVILKAIADEFPSPADTASLRREFEILRALAVPGVARPLALESFRDRLTLVLEDAGDATLKALSAEGGIDLEGGLSLAEQLATALAAVHRAGIVHKDVSANNVLVDRATMRATLTDFGIASRARSEPQRPGLPHLVEGTLAYMSPEQTGRMNRDLDHRSDLYSLGVTLYEMLTGRLPFESADPLEIIHGHVARVPTPPAARDPGIPRPLSDLVMKLLAKSAEDRYQSAEGVAADLARCRRAWTEAGAIPPFPLAQDDVRDRFSIPQRLYGREEEVARLLSAFDRVAAGGTELVLVSGYSGIGKTSLVQETYRSLAQHRGHYAAGKFDLLARDVPYGALAQAFGSLIRHLLSETDERIEFWQSRLRDALGGNGQVIVDVIPDLARLIGPQPAVPKLGSAESQNRFGLVFQRFLGVLATRDHPLVLFIDDLQWADPATLTLLPLFLTNPDLNGLLVVGAYRDNEVSPTHPLTLVVRDLAARGHPLTQLELPPLGVRHLEQLLADALGAVGESIGALAEVVHAKTGGNPFFLTQFLTSLHQDGWISFDRATRRWRADLATIRGLEMTENVVDLMAGRIQRLGSGTQAILRVAACIGNRFDLGTLSTVGEKSASRCAADLWPAVEMGLVVAEEQSYGVAPDPSDGRPLEGRRFRFLHDRVQQAAYALIPESEKRQAHLTVGRLLLAHGGDAEGSDGLFEVVNQLNYGADLISEPGERRRLAELNLRAGRRAKASAAYPSASTYFAAGVDLLPAGAWEDDYDLAFALEIESAEAAYLCGRFEEAERTFRRVLERAVSPLDKADAYALLIVQYETLERYADAIRAAREGLRLLDVDLPESAADKEAALAVEVERIRVAIGDREIASLVDLPTMTDPRIRRAVKLLMVTWASAYIIADVPLASLMPARMVSLSLEYGNCEESAFGYVFHGVTVGSHGGDYETGQAFGELALAVNERLADLRLRAKAHHIFSAFVNPWRRPFSTSLPHAREAYESGLRSGDLQFAGYGLFHQSWYGFLIDPDLETFEQNYRPSVDFLRRINMRVWADIQQMILNWGRALRGRTAAPSSLNDADFDEDAYWEANGRNGIFGSFFLTTRLGLLYTMGEVGAAVALAESSETTAELFTGSVWPAMFVFFHLLTLTAWLPGAPASERPAADAKLDRLLARLQRWAGNSPHNFGHWALLAGAEVARVRGRVADAIEGYEAALEAAAAQPSPRHRALANELYGEFWLGRQQPKVAAVLLAEARFGYLQWGAEAKAAQLERRHGRILGPATGPAATGFPTGILQTTQEPASVFDLATVIKAAQALAAEIDLEQLLGRLMRLAIEHAGAERGLFVLENDGAPAVHASGTRDRVEVRADAGTPLAETRDLPITLVNLVRRSEETVILSDAAREEAYAQDPYLTRARPRSVICTPVVHQGRLLGALYLENNLSAGVFTAERAEVLGILASQAAIAIVNARMFAEIRQLRDRLQAENVYLIEEIKTHHRFEEIVGRTPPLLDVLRQVEQVAPTDTTVLVTGETGTGKELIARAVHDLSPRRGRALVTVNCGAISPGLVESELFGHEKGAFTGAVSRKIGRFELANGGTIFLDEIGELPPEAQVKLLRVLQEHELERVGGTQTIALDVRVIAATNRDLAKAALEGTFRQDLYYRVNVFPIRMPPLRQRPDDIPLLVHYFVARYAAKIGRPITRVPGETMRRLVEYDWPGNVRELENVIERAVILSPGPDLQVTVALPTTRPIAVRAPGESGPATRVDAAIESAPAAPVREPGATRKSALADVERAHIIEVLRGTAWRIDGPAGAALLLGMNPSTLRSRMKKLGISREMEEDW